MSELLELLKSRTTEERSEAGLRLANEAKPAHISLLNALQSDRAPTHANLSNALYHLAKNKVPGKDVGLVLTVLEAYAARAGVSLEQFFNEHWRTLYKLLAEEGAAAADKATRVSQGSGYTHAGTPNHAG
jgi:hypothetical protein